ncbi:MAG: 30S ribosome-binding factor RbfA [Cyclobacteriaceae bacterium]|nr:30S ribosome-binding factor RbfA [Cyclobacteriaceae bacterium]
MESQRQKKFSRLILKEISDIFQVDKKGILGGQLVTVMDVKASPDLSVAKIYLSFMMVKDREQIFNMINERKSEIRNMLGQRIGKQVRKVPELIFYIDEVEENAARLEDILKNLHIPPAKEN